MHGNKAASILFLFLSLTLTRASSPDFTATTPPGAQRGTELEVTLRGEHLDDAKELMFYQPGIEVLGLSAITNSSLKARLKITGDCAIGEHLIRVRTASGISPMRIFMVGAFPQIEEIEPNNTPAQAQKISLNTTVFGTLTSEDVDYFEVEAKKGARLSLEVEGARLGRTMLDPYIAISDPSGKTIARADDNPLLLQDPYLSLIIPQDGAYTIELRDTSYSGNGHAYRLHVGTFSRPSAVYPPGGMTGETLEAKFIGDPLGEFTQSFKLPASPQSKYPVLSNHDGLTVSPNWLRVSPFPNVLESEPNDDRTNATSTQLPLPLAFNGILSHAGDADYFRFTAKKDQNLEFQVYARRLGSPADTILTLFDGKGKYLSENDDSDGPDSYLKMKMPEDGEYLIKINDQLGRGGPAFVYRVEVTESHPLVTLSIPDASRNDTELRKSIVVPRGNRFAVLMNVKRENFGGDLDLRFDGLPPGITLHAAPLVSGQTQVPVVFEAEPDAPLAGKFLIPFAQPAKAGETLTSIFSHNVVWVRIQNDTVYSSTDVHEVAAAVTEEVPFKITIIEPKMPLVQSGTADLKIVADRREGFDEPITVKMVLSPPKVGSLPEITIPKGTNAGYYRLNAQSSAETKKWPIAVVATAKIKDAPVWVSSQLATLEIAPRWMSGKIDLTTIERGKSGKLVCKLEQLSPFDGKATFTLTGLPTGTTAEDIQITKEDKEAVFNIVTTDKSPLGQQKGIFCSARITRDDETITQNISRAGAIRIEAPKTKEKDADKTPAPKTVASAADKSAPPSK